MCYQPGNDPSPSMKVQFSRGLFWGKREELQGIIMKMQREATQYVVRPDADQETFQALLTDLAIARSAYYGEMPTIQPVDQVGQFTLNNN